MYDMKKYYKKDIMDFLVTGKTMFQNLKMNFCKIFGRFLFEIENKKIRITNLELEEIIFEDSLNKVLKGTSINFDSVLDTIINNEFGRTFTLNEITKLLNENKRKNFYIVLEYKVNGYSYENIDKEQGNINFVDFNFRKNRNSNYYGNIVGIYGTEIEAEIIPRTFLNISENGISGFTTRILMVDKNFVEIYFKLKKNFSDKSEEELIFKTLVESKRNRLIFSGEKSLNYKISLKILKFLEDDNIKFRYLKYIDTNEENIKDILFRVLSIVYIENLISKEENTKKIKDEYIKKLIKEDLQLYKNNEENINGSNKSILYQTLETFDTYEYKNCIELCYWLKKEDKENLIEKLENLNDFELEEIRKGL